MTKLYLSNNTAPLAPPIVAGIAWGSTATRVIRELSEAPGGVAASNVATDTVATTNHLIAHGAWISSRQVLVPGPLNFAGGVDLAIGHLESSTAADAYLAIGIYIISADGSVRRAGGAGSTSQAEHPTTATGRNTNLAGLPAVTAAQVGDRLMVEVGVQFRNAVSTSYTATAYYGGTGADITIGATGTPVTTTTSSSRAVPYIDFTDPSFDALFAAPRRGDHFHTLAAA